ncbi:YggT family protein [Pseudonocardia thermophila]|uniref:YggT family protein n=1 Tax=Pseudonocardia thermophila TaxID=1848 RepID=UPI00248DC122|nr:YggT family protein [Pseudonocardia thermophila]
MGLIGTLLGYVVTLFILVMLVRLVLDWVALAGRSPDWATRTRELTHRATEPVIAPVRRVLPPVRAGGIGIDLAFTLVFVAAIIVRSILFSL